MDDEQKNKEGKEFNAAEQAAIKKAKALPELIYDNLNYDWSVSESVDGVHLTEKGHDNEQEEGYYGTEDGDVNINWDIINGDNEYFPQQLSLEDIVRLVKVEGNHDAEKMALMVERGVDPQTTSPEKLKQYLFGDGSHVVGTAYDGIPEDEYSQRLVDQYTELWNEAKEKQILASEILKNRAAERVAEQAKKDQEAAAAVLDKIEAIPETSPAVSTPEVTPQPIAPAKEPKEGFWSRWFGRKK